MREHVYSSEVACLVTCAIMRSSRLCDTCWVFNPDARPSEPVSKAASRRPRCSGVVGFVWVRPVRENEDELRLGYVIYRETRFPMFHVSWYTGLPSIRCPN